MTDKPVKERLAEILAGDYCPHWFYEENMDEIVAELRRQYEEIEAKDALLRQALEALEDLNGYRPDIDKAINAIHARIGEKT
jgi:hypothetical protein